MTNTIERFLDDPKNLDVSDIEYTNKKVLDNHFNEFLIKTSEKDALKKALDNNTVIHFSLFDNTEKYNLDKLENFPEYTKSVKYYISDNEIYEPNASKNIIVERLLFEKEKIKNLHYISNAAASYVNKIF
jgi:hypothetical protein